MTRRGLLMGMVILLAGTLVALAGPLDQAEMEVIRLYQRFVSPAMGHFVTCRFSPTCSVYALQVLEKDGFWKGNLRIGLRLMLCSPVGALLSVAGG